MAEAIQSYPLQWPLGWRRTPATERTWGKFTVRKRETASYREVTVHEAIGRVHDQLARMNVHREEIVVSTNLPTALSGMPRSDAKRPDDPGASVYWRTKQNEMKCMAIDTYTTVEQNIAAIAASLEAMRAIERHGGAQVMDRAFSGFAALPPAPVDWRAQLGFNGAPVTADEVQTRFRELSLQKHPDRGGTASEFDQIVKAKDAALRELGITN